MPFNLVGDATTPRRIELLTGPDGLNGSSGLCLCERFKLRSNSRRFNIRMYRGVATVLVALAAFDYFYLDGNYRQHRVACRFCAFTA
jgi:hypothetical protein